MKKEIPNTEKEKFYENIIFVERERERELSYKFQKKYLQSPDRFIDLSGLCSYQLSVSS